jgi:hypothetical protein
MLHAITFSFPEEKIIKNIPNKTKFISDLVPGNLETYIYIRIKLIIIMIIENHYLLQQLKKLDGIVCVIMKL